MSKEGRFVVGLEAHIVILKDDLVPNDPNNGKNSVPGRCEAEVGLDFTKFDLDRIHACLGILFLCHFTAFCLSGIVHLKQ